MRENTPSLRFLNLFTAQYKTLAGKEGKWTFASRSREPMLCPSVNAVIVVAMVRTAAGPRLLCTSEFRIPIGCREYGFCAGLIDKGETPEQAAKRELKEETGLTVTKVVLTSPPLVSSAGLSDEAVHLVFVEAEGEISTAGQEANEDIKPFLADSETIERMVYMMEEFDGAIAAKAWPVLMFFNFVLNMGINLDQIFDIMVRDLVGLGYVASVNQPDELIASPQNGGCWYCHKKTDDMMFSTEFDTAVHKECIEQAAQDPSDREAQIFKRELLGG
jgi:ADP-ribose pyrophosphatase